MAVVAETGERPWLEELNAEQRAAATHAGGPLLILAGAGTGKTTTLCSRVAWLVSEGVAVGADPAADVHAPGVARDAAAGARARARRRPACSAAPSIRSRTGSCAGTPRRWGCRAGSGCSTPAMPPTCSTCCAPSTGTRSPRRASRARRTLLDIYSRTVNAQAAAVGRDRGALPVVLGAPRGDLGAVRAYTARKRELGVVDLDDLLLFWRALAADERDRAAARRRRSTTC